MFHLQIFDGVFFWVDRGRREHYLHVVSYFTGMKCHINMFFGSLQSVFNSLFLV